MKRAILLALLLASASPLLAQQVDDPLADASAYCDRAILRIKMAEYDKALADSNEAIRLDPKCADGYYYRALAWDGKGDYDKAIADFHEAIRLDPEDAGAVYNNLGMVWQEKGKYDKAIADFTEAIRLEPRSGAFYSNRGKAWDQQGEYDKAIADFSEAIRLCPTFDWVYAQRGLTWAKKGEYDNAIADLSEVIRLEPDYADGYFNRGAVWQRIGEYQKAIADYNEAIRREPDYGLPYNNLAWIRATCPIAKYRDGPKAVEYAKKACELTDWRKGRFLDTLAAAYAEAGDFDQAVKWQKKALSMVADDYREECRAHLQRYKSRKPYRDAPKDQQPSKRRERSKSQKQGARAPEVE